MIDSVARGRRSALVLAVIVGMMAALFTTCCCLQPDHPSAADPVHVVAQAGASHGVTAVGGGHSGQDCQESVASVAVAVGSASVPDPLVVAVAGGPVAGQVPRRAGTPGQEALPPPPIPHLLGVMRT